MGMGLVQRRQDAIRRCTQEAQSTKTTLLFGMTTSLMLQTVPIPPDCGIDETLLHTVSSSRTKRVRKRALTMRNHIWKPLPPSGHIRINQLVYALDLRHTWAQLSNHLTLESTIILGESIVTAISRQPALANGRAPDTILRELDAWLTSMPRFKGKRLCEQAMAMMRPHAESPQETRTRLGLLAHGLPDPVASYAVPNVTFRSGSPMTLDLAWPDHLVAVEYDGDQHRTDRTQWRRDQEKRDRLRGRGWHIGIATAATLADDASRADFAFSIARVLAGRGAIFDFHVLARPLERIARERAGRSDTGGM
ncbi:hypothetical protein JS531_03770 [Bifidobacterium sp. CP2]|uniref:hypothetical protein n=1 Tax=Bifidobacterium sp. CP2 TaxID=2809025 RepID=UPI001BDD87C0|nr:hypothetical protein [Bifidobacterium sp. CP2]MBT1181100.1 hypothetical protein [Bifidobacterium sp. CP2]